MDINDPTRKRGILNQREREWLQGEREEIERHSADERAIRGAIRDHLENAILDFQLLVENLPERDLDRVFGKSTSDHTERQEREHTLRPALQSMFALVYGATNGTRLDFEDLVGVGVWSGAHRYFDRPDRADIEIVKGTTVDIDSVLVAAEGGDLESLSDLERLWLLQQLDDDGKLSGVREGYESSSEGQMIQEMQDEIDEVN